MNEIESLLQESASGAPEELRAKIEDSVRRKIRRQTFVDDCKWLSLTIGLLCVVLFGQWALFQYSHASLQKISQTEIASAETARVMASLRDASAGASNGGSAMSQNSKGN